jgi:hypothetical protein
MPEKRGAPWIPLLIITAAGFVLMLSSCFGVTLASSGAVTEFLDAAALVGVIVMALGMFALVVVAVMALIFWFWEDKS